MKKLKFSIITPCRNRLSYLRETIDSVLNQTAFKKNICEMQYIIIDGASTDGSKELIEEYARNNQNIEFISENDESMYDALRKGFEKCNGDIISYINAGDLYNINAFEIVEIAFKSSDKIKWLTGTKYIYNENSQIIRNVVPYNYRPRLIQSGVYGRFLPFIQQESTFWKKELNELIDLDKLKKFKLAGDYYIWSSFSKKYKIEIIQTQLGGLKIHDNQLSTMTLNGNLTYQKEVDMFKKKISLIDFLYIIIDIIPWTILKYSNDFFGYISNHIRFDLDTSKFSYRGENKDEIYCWACDFATNRGEGKLSNKFLTGKFEKKNIHIKTISQKFYFNKNQINKNSFTEKKINLNFTESYLAPLVGIFWLWWKYLNGKKICYLNFLPLWNSFLFILLPPTTILGPITGSVHKGEIKNVQTFLRKYLLPTLYYINSKLLLLRKQKLIFATSLLKKYFKGDRYSNLKFGYILENIQYGEYNKSKEIDIAIYYREYDTKSNELFKKLIEYCSNKKEINFVYFGHKCKQFADNYLGFITNQKVIDILKKTKFSILSEENFESFFANECLSNHVNIFYDPSKMKKPENLDNSKKLIDLNYDNHEESISIIESNIKNFDKLDFSYN